MKAVNFFVVLCIAFICSPVFMTAQGNPWKEVRLTDARDRNSSRFPEMPAEYNLYQVNLENLSERLRQVSSVDDGLDEELKVVLDIPVGGGDVLPFAVYEQPVMEKGLQARYPQLKAYKGYSLTNPAVQVWFTLSPHGFSGAVTTQDGIVYIDQMFDNDKTQYLVYPVDTYKNNPYAGIPLCGTEHAKGEKSQAFMPFNRSAGEVEMRVYRLAMACTGEWGRVASRGTVEKCLADMNIMVTRLTQIYESELAIRFVLVNDNDKIIFIDPLTDPYVGSDMARTILPTNTGVLNERIGANNYDIGHVLSICFDVGGVAQLGSACQSNKGNGVTCFNNNNFEYAVASIMAHEVGHQFDATHTFNSCAPSQENATASTAYEPGSGTTIMSYGGLCGVDNVFGGSDAYFHVASLEQMLEKTLPGGDAYNCAQKIASGNINPDIVMPAGGFTIPRSTPFELTAAATDADGDALTYRWEQYNLGPQSTLGSPVGTAPLFRSFNGTSSPTRFFPAISKIFRNQLTTKEEILPSITRNLTFKCVVKDNKPAGVGVVWDQVSFEVTADAGPFTITYPKLDAKFDIGDEVEVTWDVANTNVAPVNCKSVNIYVSYNEALHTGDPNLVLVAQEVPNNGSRKIVIPNKVSNKVNFVIKAADNIFLTTSVLPSIVQTPTSPTVYADIDQEVVTTCLPATPEFVFSTSGLGGLTDSIHFEIAEGLPGGAVVSFSENKVLPGESSVLSLNMDDVQGKGTAEIAVRIFVPGVDTIIRYVRVHYTATNLDPLNTVLPADGTTGGSVLPVFTWDANSDAALYRIQLATNPSFDAGTVVFEVTRTGVTTFTSSVILEKSAVYYWRVRAENPCKNGEWSAVKAFSTEVLSCQEFKSGPLTINISASGKPTVETALNVGIEGLVSDLNVSLIRIDHQRNGDLIPSLISPSGKEIVLWSKRCGTQKNISVGLDDESPIFFGCPLNNNRILKPENKLSGFQGESTKGNWTLRVRDDEAGEGGRLLEFNMEICSNVAVAAPVLVTNNVLQIPPGDKPSIWSTHLLAEDSDNTAEQLRYTIVSLPVFGSLTLNGNILVVGSTFTQQDINNGSLKYNHGGSDMPSDSFTFTIVDGQGGWIPITTFAIEVDESFPSNTNDVAREYNIKVFPNPVAGQDVYIQVGHKSVIFDNYSVYDATGRKMSDGRLSENQAVINVASWMSGMYTVRLFNKTESATTTFIKK